jgi:hypothetical protein
MKLEPSRLKGFLVSYNECSTAYIICSILEEDSGELGCEG